MPEAIIIPIPRWLRALFAWRDVRDSGVWAYRENGVTGKRRAVRVGSGWQPVDCDWLERREPRVYRRPPPSSADE